MTDFELLQYYRQEDHQEWTLLMARLGSYLTSQSFLFGGYAISMGNTTHWGFEFSLYFPIFLAFCGFGTSLGAVPGLSGAAKTIQLWHDKQEQLVARSPELKSILIDRRSSIRGGASVDVVHRRSLAFAGLAPWVYGIAWIGLVILDLWMHRPRP